MGKAKTPLHFTLQKLGIGGKLGQLFLHGNGPEVDLGETGIDPLSDPETDANARQTDEKQTGQKSENFGSQALQHPDFRVARLFPVHKHPNSGRTCNPEDRPAPHENRIPVPS